MGRIFLPTFLALTFLVISLLVVVFQSQKNGRVRLVEWSALAMGGVHGGVWVLVMLATDEGKNPFWAGWLLRNVSSYAVHTVSALILFTCMYIGWILASAWRPNVSCCVDVDVRAYERRLYFGGWLLLIVSFVMQSLYTKAYGGIFEIFEYSNLIRAGVFAVDNSLSFLQPFGGLAIFSSFIFLGLILDRRAGVSGVIGFLLAFIFSIYVLMSWQGRISFLAYFAAIFLGILIKIGVRPFVLIAGGGGLLVGMVLIAYQVSSLLGVKASESLIFFVAKELSFPFGAFFAQLSNGQNLFRGFLDFVYSPVYLLPSSWWLSFVEPVGQVNTEVIMGAKKGELDVTGSMPVDLLTLGLMQASVAGVALVGGMFGVLLYFCETVLSKVSSVGVRSVLEAYFVIKLAVLAVFYAEPQLVVSGNFDLIMSVMLIVLLRRYPRDLRGL